MFNIKRLKFNETGSCAITLADGGKATINKTNAQRLVKIVQGNKRITADVVAKDESGNDWKAQINHDTKMVTFGQQSVTFKRVKANADKAGL